MDMRYFFWHNLNLIPGRNFGKHFQCSIEIYGFASGRDIPQLKCGAVMNPAMDVKIGVPIAPIYFGSDYCARVPPESPVTWYQLRSLFSGVCEIPHHMKSLFANLNRRLGGWRKGESSFLMSINREFTIHFGDYF